MSYSVLKYLLLVPYRKCCYAFFFPFLFVVSCRKQNVDLLPLAIYNTGYAFRINDLFLQTDSIWFAVGGVRGEEGVILRTDDAGLTWSKFNTEFPRSMYCVNFLNQEIGFAGGEYLQLWRTSDGGNSWSYYWLDDQVPFNEEDRPAIRDFEFRNDSCWFFCGGENLGEGVVYETRNAGANWNFIFKQNEFRSLVLLNEDKIVVGGHGLVLSNSDHIDHLSNADFVDDFMTGMTVIGHDNCIGVTYNGAILKGTNSGMNWMELEKGNKAFNARINWNDVDAFGARIVAVGNEGVIAESTDSGVNWRYYEVVNSPELISVKVVKDFVLATTTDGRILRLF